MEIIGSEATLSLRGGSGSELMLYPHPVFRPSDGDQSWTPVTDLPDSGLGLGNQLAIRDLIDAAESDREPVSSAAAAVAAAAAVTAAVAAATTYASKFVCKLYVQMWICKIH